MLVERCRSARVVVLFVLTYDGRIVWNPGDPEDEFVTEVFNRHQRTNKGFGPALGPTATQTSMARLMDKGYHVRSHTSDWHLGPSHPMLQQELLKGWTEASVELQSESRSLIGAWAQRRRTRIKAGRSSLIVGHADVLGWPV